MGTSRPAAAMDALRNTHGPLLLLEKRLQPVPPVPQL
jgi:hypothetical protein